MMPNGGTWNIRWTYQPSRQVHTSNTTRPLALAHKQHSHSFQHMDLNNMGQRQNRKRVRHRPHRARKQFQYQPAPIQPSSFVSAPTAMSIRYSYAPSRPSFSRSTSYTTTSSKSMSRYREEDAQSRDRRIFGGVEGEQESTDLRGQMLDVVLGLFDGVDYDDSTF
jgi:hypothetical protein